MKVIEQLIRYFRLRGELSGEQLNALCRRGFLKVWELYDEELRGEGSAEVLEPDVLDLRQEVLERVGARKGKKPGGKRRRKSRRRWWRSELARKRQLQQSGA